MKFAPITLTLKDGTEILFREAEESDSAAIIQMVKTYLADSEFIPRIPEEFEYTVEDEKLIIRSFLEQENSLFLLAFKEGKPVGNLNVTGNQRQAMKHIGYIGMGMLQEWRGKGLGSALMQLTIDWAVNNRWLNLLWLEVYEENTAGMRLYEKFNFKVTGRQENFFRKGNSFCTNIAMTLYLNK